MVRKYLRTRLAPFARRMFSGPRLSFVAIQFAQVILVSLWNYSFNYGRFLKRIDSTKV